MGKQVDQCIGIVEALPYADNLHAVLLEYSDFAVPKPFVQIVDTALAGIDRIHPQLKTARIFRSVCSQFAHDTRPAWRGRGFRAALPTVQIGGADTYHQTNNPNTDQNS